MSQVEELLELHRRSAMQRFFGQPVRVVGICLPFLAVAKASEGDAGMSMFSMFSAPRSAATPDVIDTRQVVMQRCTPEMASLFFPPKQEAKEPLCPSASANRTA